MPAPVNVRIYVVAADVGEPHVPVAWPMPPKNSESIVAVPLKLRLNMAPCVTCTSPAAARMRGVDAERAARVPSYRRCRRWRRSW